MNYFEAIQIPIPERYFIQSASNWSGGKNSMIDELKFIHDNWSSLSENVIKNFDYRHWLYVSALLPINLRFIKQYRDKIKVAALANNKSCFNIFKMWSLPSAPSDIRFRVFKCWNCNKPFTSYRNKKIKDSYYRHPCYLKIFQKIAPTQYEKFYCTYYLRDL